MTDSQNKQTLHSQLRKAVLLADVEAVHTALAGGADVNHRDELGLSALMVAALRGHRNICECLLNAGADAAMLGPDGSDALAIAARADHEDVVNLLLEALSGRAQTIQSLPPDTMAPQRSRDALDSWIDRAHGIYEKTLDSITPKEAAIWRMRFGQEGGVLTLEAIGVHHGLSRQRISQILAKTRRKLMHPSRSDPLRSVVNDILVHVESGDITVDEIRWRSMRKSRGLGFFVYLFTAGPTEGE